MAMKNADEQVARRQREVAAREEKIKKVMDKMGDKIDNRDKEL